MILYQTGIHKGKTKRLHVGLKKVLLIIKPSLTDHLQKASLKQIGPIQLHDQWKPTHTFSQSYKTQGEGAGHFLNKKILLNHENNSLFFFTSCKI